MRHSLSSAVPPQEDAQRFSQLSRYAAKVIGGTILHRVRVVNIETTLRCNAQCDFCSHWRTKCGNELTSYLPVLEHFQPLVVNLTGGEPLLRDDLPDLISQIKRHDIYYLSLLTNGRLLTIEKARTLRACGLDGISLSLNYLGEAHDRERHIPGLYKHLSEIIPALPKLGFRRVDLNTVIMESNLDELLKIADQARAWGVGLSFSCYSSLKADKKEYDVRRLAQLFTVLAALRKKKAAGWPITSSDWYLQQIPRYYSEGGIPHCLAGRKTVHITPDGLVKPCPDLPVVAHYSQYDPAAFAPTRCKKCWYRCRGELEAPLTPKQIVFYAKHLQKTFPSSCLPSGSEGQSS